LAAGDSAVASHRSAAWLWKLVDRPAHPAEVTVPISGIRALPGVRVHRSRDLDPDRTIVRIGIPTTDPLRTLVDLGAVMAAPQLTDMLDRSLATRLVTLQGVVAEVDRLSRHGRPGVKRLRGVIKSRGLVGAPHPSVLESRMLRLLSKHQLPTPAIEITVGPEGQYRLDFAYPSVKLAIEVDGYVWHFTPEHQRRDNRRRNWLHANGWHTLIFTWIDVTYHPDEVAAAIQATLHTLTRAPL
jgi:very-short-patch-repair endonuclease